ncbi:MAG: hypothetical protein JWL80_221 [Parcubacteria group bacterium]|nr:hypothetical protein [Parcubacteria group bacterium]
MISFRLASHSHREGVEIVEILVDGVVVAVLYPDGEKQIKLVSAHLQGAGDKRGVAPHVMISDHVGESVPIPDITLTFDPRSYGIMGGMLVRDKD